MVLARPARTQAILSGLAASALFGAAVLVAIAPGAAAAVPTTGVWIFPSAHRDAVLEGSTDDAFYVGDSDNAWLQDSFFADSTADGATVEVDLYNPTSSDLYNIQVFAAFTVDHLDLVSSISFSGGETGDLTYAGDELESGGTPQMAGGVAIGAHDIYQAYFVSYGVGDLSAGSSGILTFTIDIVGDFEGGLIVHLDYTAEDADEGGVSGPFEADMNIFENGEAEEPPVCVANSLQLKGGLGNSTYRPGDWANFTARLEVMEDFTYTTGEVTVTLSAGGFIETDVEPDDVSGSIRSWFFPNFEPLNFSVNISGILGPFHLPGDIHTMTASISWDDCDVGGSDTITLSASVENTPTEKSHSASWWADQLSKTDKGKKKAVYNKTQADGMLQAVAAHSDVFTYGPWNGTAPTGEDDEGWLDISDLDDAQGVLEGKTSESKKVRGGERQALALWLNIASGALNLDTALEIYEKKHRCRGSHSEFEDQTGLSSLSSSYDTPGEILTSLEAQIKDWQDGQGASKAALKLTRRLAKAVNNEWLVAA